MKSLRAHPVFRAFASLALIALCLVLLWLPERYEPTGAPLGIHGTFDVAGHLITAFIAAIGVRALRLPVPLWSIVLGGVVLDLGHVLGFLGYVNALEGSSRNGSHSLFVVAILAGIGFLDRRHANLWLGIAMGATSHLWRDMGTGTVALTWPITETVYGTSFTKYLAVLAGIALAMIGSATLLAVHARATSTQGPSRYEGPTSQASGWET